MPATLRAVRGATTVDEDTPEADHRAGWWPCSARIMERNGLVEDDIVSILFTATEDIVSIFPATAARTMGLGAVPADLRPGAGHRRARCPRCIRVMLHVTTDRARDDIHHVYLEGAQGLRDDLPD